jgi:SAM-dependent methyltransferase
VTSQQQVEIGFWRRCFIDEEHGDVTAWTERRRRDFHDDTYPLNEAIAQQEGLGLDLGCGLTSTLGFKGALIHAVDPLLDEYDKLYKDPRPWIIYRKMSGEALDYQDATFDYVWSINCIDHTPNPDRMLSEIRRVLRPGGNLHFSVNYDPVLIEAHHSLWNRERVEAQVVRDAGFQMLIGVEKWRGTEHPRRPEYQKFTFLGVFRRP